MKTTFRMLAIVLAFGIVTGPLASRVLAAGDPPETRSEAPAGKAAIPPTRRA